MIFCRGEVNGKLIVRGLHGAKCIRGIMKAVYASVKSGRTNRVEIVAHLEEFKVIVTERQVSTALRSLYCRGLIKHIAEGHWGVQRAR